MNDATHAESPGPGPSPMDLAYDARGLIPAIVQQHDTGEVLMMGWMTAATLEATLQRGETVFWSRSRGAAWHKGASSGNVQRVIDVVADCDDDALLVRVDQRGAHDTPQGPACHTGMRTCFHRGLRPPR